MKIKEVITIERIYATTPHSKESEKQITGNKNNGKRMFLNKSTKIAFSFTFLNPRKIEERTTIKI